MKRTKSEMKEILLAEIDEELEEAFARQEQSEHPNLSEFEEQVLAIRQSIGIRVLKEILKNEEDEVSKEMFCPKCKSPMQAKGKRRQIIETRLGTLELEREYFYCKPCQEGIFPPIRTIAGL